MGTSPYMPLPLQVAGDHPHAYGDKFLTKNGYLPDEGSSPRVWGQVTRYLHMLKDSRIIPTRMGTRSGVSLEVLADKDHPHAYGDK